MEVNCNRNVNSLTLIAQAHILFCLTSLENKCDFVTVNMCIVLVNGPVIQAVTKERNYSSCC